MLIKPASFVIIEQNGVDIMKKSIFKRITAVILALIIAFLLPSCSKKNKPKEETTTADFQALVVDAEDEVTDIDEIEDETSDEPYSEDKTEAEDETEAETTTEETTEKTTQKTTYTQKTTGTQSYSKTQKTAQNGKKVVENGKYDTKDEVALYIHTFGHLPSNYITKRQAEDKGWSGGSLKYYAPGCCIGGDRFGNYEGKLPKAKGRTYKECDIGTMNAKSRGAKRIIFSNDGLIYYTDDHYESFTKLY